MKRLKANFFDVIEQNIEYHGYKRIKNKNGVMADMYTLCKPLTHEQKTFFEQFKNVVIGESVYKFANEIKYQTLILADKCLH